jgi:hypothetical protein
MPSCEIPGEEVTGKTSRSTDHNLCGLSWPESGSPFFFCVAGEKRDEKDKSFDDPTSTIEIIYEHECRTMTELTDSMEMLKGLHCQSVFTILEPKYLTYIRAFNTWRHEDHSKIILKQTKSSSFEASLIKVKELIGDKRLKFPERSVVRSQLTVFSKSNLKDSDNFFAVKALTMVVDVFGKKATTAGTDEVPNQRGWW